MVMSTLTASPPKYSAILELDRRLRDMPLPKYAQGPPPQNCGLAQTMSHYMPINYLHLSACPSLVPELYSRHDVQRYFTSTDASLLAR